MRCHTLINRKSGCGKTYFLLKYLEKECQSKYDHIYIIYPTFSINSTWQSWKYKNDPGVTVLETREVNKAIKMVIHKKSKNSKALLILDDVAATKDIKSQSSELVSLGFSGRHYGISTIVLTQQLTSVAKAYRENISYLVTFYTPGKKDTKVIADDFLDPDANAEKIRKELRDNKYARLEINLEAPYDWKICK